jgi:hypothetical protein
MAEKKRVYETDVMALPPLRLVLGDVPAPDPDGRHPNKKRKLSKQEEETVRKLIAHLKASEK